MCGIVGQLLSQSEASVSRGQIEAMLSPMGHRGPDGQGIHLDGSVGLGHCRLSIIDVAQRVGLSLDEIAPLTGPDNRTADASAHIRALADDKLPRIKALITRAQAVKQWLEVARHCDCESVDVCGLFVDPTLLPPVAEIDLDVRQVRSRP